MTLLFINYHIVIFSIRDMNVSIYFAREYHEMSFYIMTGDVDGDCRYKNA